MRTMLSGLSYSCSSYSSNSRIRTSSTAGIYFFYHFEKPWCGSTKSKLKHLSFNPEVSLKKHLAGGGTFQTPRNAWPRLPGIYFFLRWIKVIVPGNVGGKHIYITSYEWCIPCYRKWGCIWLMCTCVLHQASACNKQQTCKHLKGGGQVCSFQVTFWQVVLHILELYSDVNRVLESSHVERECCYWSY